MRESEAAGGRQSGMTDISVDQNLMLKEPMYTSDIIKNASNRHILSGHGAVYQHVDGQNWLLEQSQRYFKGDAKNGGEINQLRQG